MDKANILLQLDTDQRPSVFDSVVAVDAGVDHLLQHGGVTPEEVQGLVHGLMFTRGPQDLKHSAIFVGGSDVAAGEKLVQAVTKTFFGPLRVSVMMDSNGANTTAAAAVLAASRHLDLSQTQAVVLGGTGPVGQRVARLLARKGAKVLVGSRSAQRAQKVCDSLLEVIPESDLRGVATGTDEETAAALAGSQLVIAAGAAGVVLLPEAVRQEAKLAVAVDLNAVPPLGIGGIEVHDKAKDQGGTLCYGAIGVGGLKMKIHTAALQKLFAANDAVLDAEEIFAIGEGFSD